MILNGEPCAVNEEIMNLALYGNACFTTMLVNNGAVRGLRLHLSRLQQDAEQLFGLSVNPDKILADVQTFLEHTSSSAALIVRVTVFPASFSFSHPERSMDLSILVTGRAQQENNRGSFRVQSVATQRSLPLQKSVNMMAGFRARRSARLSGFDDALLIANGVICEGPTWNVFFVQENALFTPGINSGVLPGVTRSLVLSCCEEAGFTCQEREINICDLSQYRAVFATNSSLGVLPIDVIDGYSYPDQEIVAQIEKLYSKIPGDGIIRPR